MAEAQDPQAEPPHAQPAEEKTVREVLKSGFY